MRKIKLALLYGILLVVAVLIWAFLIPHYTTTKLELDKPHSPNNLEITVRKYPIPRELIWSGIPPFYGGYLPDPHIVSTRPKIYEFSLGETTAKLHYQGISINPWFKNRPAKNIFAIELEGKVYQYFAGKIDISGNYPIFAITHLKGSVVFFSPHIGKEWNGSYQFQGGVIKVSWPLELNASELIYDTDTEFWNQTLNEIRVNGVSNNVAQELCASRNKSAIRFIEEIQAGACSDS